MVDVAPDKTAVVGLHWRGPLPSQLCHAEQFRKLTTRESCLSLRPVITEGAGETGVIKNVIRNSDFVNHSLIILAAQPILAVVGCVVCLRQGLHTY